MAENSILGTEAFLLHWIRSWRTRLCTTVIKHDKSIRTLVHKLSFFVTHANIFLGNSVNSECGAKKGISLAKPTALHSVECARIAMHERLSMAK